MAWERREGDGVLFRNNRKQKDTHPDYTGNALIGGVEHDIAAWVKQSRDGTKKFFSLSIKPREDGERFQGQSPARSAPERGTRGGSRSWPPDGEDDLPF